MKNDYNWDNHAEARWEYVLDEMIFAFEMKVKDDWAEDFRSGEIDMLRVPVDKDGNEVTMSSVTPPTGHDFRFEENSIQVSSVSGLNFVDSRFTDPALVGWGNDDADDPTEEH